jgi:chromosome segregation ATPase
MEENMRGRFILILTILTAIFFVGTVGSCASVSKLKSARDKEVESRMEAEDKLNKFTQEKSSIEAQVKSVSQALEEEKAAHQASKKALLQEQLVNQSLKEELGKVVKLKEALEEDLKEALVNSRTTKTKK